MGKISFKRSFTINGKNSRNSKIIRKKYWLYSMQKITNHSRMVLTLSSTTNIINTDINMSKVHHFKRYKGICTTISIIITSSGRNVILNWPKLWKLLVIYVNCLTEWHKFNVPFFRVPGKKEKETRQDKVDPSNKSQIHRPNGALVQWYVKKNIEQKRTGFEETLQTLWVKNIDAHYDSTSCLYKYSLAFCLTQFHQIVHSTNRLQSKKNLLLLPDIIRSKP